MFPLSGAAQVSRGRFSWGEPYVHSQVAWSGRRAAGAGVAADVVLARWRDERYAGDRRATSNGSLTFGGLTRTYSVHLPSSYNGTTALPLFLILHGRLGDGSGMITLSGMNSTRRR